MSGTRRLAAAVLIAWAAIALAAWWRPPPANAIALDDILAAPTADCWLGRDDLGRLLSARLAAGAQVSLSLAAVVILLTTTLGVTVGLVAGWCGGWIDLVLVRVIDIVLAFPGILLAIALAGVLGPGLDNVVIALAAVGWAGCARLVRAQCASLRMRDHVQVAHALGVGTPRTLAVHVLPLLVAPLAVEITFAAGAVIVAEAGLSFLGLGVQPPTPSWGGMIRDGMRYVLVAPHAVAVPALALASVALSMNVLGDALRERWQPRSR
jgi:peptide/nickel transport system permease protein